MGDYRTFIRSIILLFFVVSSFIQKTFANMLLDLSTQSN